MSWLILGVAVITEITWALSLKWAATVATWQASSVPIVLSFEALFGFLDAEGIDLFRIVHGEQRFAYERPIRIGERLTATLSVATLRQIGGADIIGTQSRITDAEGALVCTAKATVLHTAGAA